jgi:hypothetical protein
VLAPASDLWRAACDQGEYVLPAQPLPSSAHPILREHQPRMDRGILLLALGALIACAAAMLAIFLIWH